MRVWLAVLFMLSAGIACSASAQEANEPEQTSIWREERVGHVVVGAPQDSGRSPLAYGYYFAAIGPKPALVTKPYGDCLKSSLFRAAERFRRDVVYNWAEWPEDGLYDDAQVRRTTEALNSARAVYRDAVRQECAAVARGDPFRAYVDGTRLAVVKRECKTGECKGLESVSLRLKRIRCF